MSQANELKCYKSGDTNQLAPVENQINTAKERRNLFRTLWTLD